MHIPSIFAFSAFITITLAYQQVRLPSYLSREEHVSINPKDYPAEHIYIPIDHYNDNDNRTFSNRFWVNSKYYSPGGPVFYFDAGEQSAHPLVPYFLYEASGPSSVMTLARMFNGLAVLSEHRFYGDAGHGSFPFPMNADGMAEGGYDAYKYLTTEQALQDPVYFAHHFEPPGLEHCWDELKPETTPWVWLGGSYPGIRGAMMRVRNPETFYATWASSAPTEAAVDMWTYYAQAERSMTRNCSADYTAITYHVDSILANGTKAEQDELKIALYTAVMSTPGGSKPSSVNKTEARQLSNADVGNYLLLPLSFYQYYGFEASVQPFCDIMQTENRTHVRTTDNGGTAPALAFESGLAEAHNIPRAWQAFLVGIAEIDYDSVPYEGDPITGYSWMWQYCSEYGYYQRGNPENPHTIQSRFISLERFQHNCDETFPEGLPPQPNVSAANKYGGWHMNPSNTMFSSGEYDPWRALSPASVEVGSPNRTSMQKIPECNVAPPSDTVFGMVYRDMVHVSDMRALLNESDVNHQNFSTVGFSSPISTEPFYAGVGLFQMALEEWLPCFRGGKYGEMTFQFPSAVGEG
ncbi:uncharacterized protein LTR77_010175 [Saxophila tyrrhenica]|uniref:Uncharacterized protein n=1 Tax=Saxophila tyrrhenica TaxID=1690608 RepID=A0AAV9NXS7_9PEZI|nr:hypothetical protein LTR77_010175 [Saxophila tyrrhenica]